MKAVSNVLGTAIGIILITAVLIAFASYFNSVNSTAVQLLHAEKENLYIKPFTNSSGTYISIYNPGPTEPVTISYVIVKNISNGLILSIKSLWKRLEVGDTIDILILNTTNYSDKLVTIIITDNGAVFYKDLDDDGNPSSTIIYNVNNNSWYVNPDIGWAFNKSIVVEDGSSTIYYLIPYLIGDTNWNSQVVTNYRNYTGFPILVKFGQFDNNLVFEYMVVKVITPDISSSGQYECWFYLLDNSGWKRPFGRIITDGTYKENGVWMYIEAFGNKTIEYPYFNLTYIVYYTPSSTDNSYIYYGCGMYNSTHFIVNITYDYGYGAGDDAYLPQYFLFDLKSGSVPLYLYINKTGEQHYLSENESETTWIYGGRVRYADWKVENALVPLNVYVKFNFTVVGSAGSMIWWVINPDPSYNVSVKVPYMSYDLYLLNISGGKVSNYIRPSDQRVYLSYQDYILPGENNLTINCTVPEIYRVLITQPDPSLPSYLVFIGWIDPSYIVDIINGGNPLLMKYGLVDVGSSIVFRYNSIVFKDGKFMGNYSSGDSITLGYGVYAVIPLDGSLAGNIVYLWVDNWRLIRG